jgi:hypothetical protein
MKHNTNSPTRSTPAVSNESAGNDTNPPTNSEQPIVFDLRCPQPEAPGNEDAYGPDPEDLYALRIALRLAWCYFILCCTVIVCLLQTHPEIWVALRKWFACLFKL